MNDSSTSILFLIVSMLIMIINSKHSVIINNEKLYITHNTISGIFIPILCYSYIFKAT